MKRPAAGHPSEGGEVDESLRERFERDWLSGKSPAVRDYLPPASAENYLATLEELIQIDLEFVWKDWARRRSQGAPDAPPDRPTPIPNYLQQFPVLVQPQFVSRMLRQELRVRREQGDGAAADQSESQFTQMGISLSVDPTASRIAASPQFLGQLQACALLPSDVERSESTMHSAHGGETIMNPGAAPTASTQTTAVDTIPFDPAAPAPGMHLGQYRLVKKLGEGGMGAVWQAVHQRLRKPVAVKLLSAHLLRDPALVARFEREMEAIGRVEHPHLVRAYDAGEEHGTHFLVMELIDGVDLAQRVKKHGPLSVKSALECIRQAALGLAEAHRVGMVHRDIKPGNLMLTRQGHIKVTDLGLARLQTDVSAKIDQHTITSAGQILGTPDFMAPEQWDNTHTVDARCDLYALGCTFFFLLTGRAPFSDQASIARKLQAHGLLPPPDLSKAVASSSTLSATDSRDATRNLAPSTVSAEICALYEKLMAKNPADRFQTATDLVTTIDQLKQGSATSVLLSSQVADTFASITLTATPAEPQLKSRQRSTRRRITPVTIAAGIGLCAVVGLMLAWQLAPMKNQPPVTQDKNRVAVAKKSTNPPVAFSSAFPAPNYASERDVAAWVLSLGGSVAIGTLEAGHHSASLPLPTTNFQVMDIGFYGNTRVRNADLRRLLSLSKLQNLALHDCPQIGDFGIAQLEHVRTLHHVDLSGTGISDRALKSLAQLTELRKLRFDKSRLTDDGVAWLKGLPFLTELYLNEIENVSIDSLRKLRTLPLTNLEFSSTRVRYSDIPELVDCFPQLIFFSTRGLEADVTDALTPLARLSQLKYLQLCTHDLPPGGGLRLAKLPNVKHVTIGYGDAPAKEFFTELAGATQLEHLGIADVTIDSAALEILARNSSIRVLALSGAGFGDADILALSKMPSLKELALYTTKVSDGGAQQFHALRPDVTISGHMNLPATTTAPQ